MVASGHGVSSSPVSTSVRPTMFCKKKGSDTSASICAQNEQMDVPIDSEKAEYVTGLRAAEAPAMPADGEQKEPNDQHGDNFCGDKFKGMPLRKTA